MFCNMTRIEAHVKIFVHGEPFAAFLLIARIRLDEVFTVYSFCNNEP